MSCDVKGCCEGREGKTGNEKNEGRKSPHNGAEKKERRAGDKEEHTLGQLNVVRGCTMTQKQRKKDRKKDIEP